MPNRSLLCPVYPHPVGILYSALVLLSVSLLIAALVILNVLAPSKQTASCFSRFSPPAANIPLRLPGYRLPRLDLSNFRSHPRLLPHSSINSSAVGSPPTLGARLVQRCVRQENFPSLDPLGDSLQGLDGGPVSCCLRAWRRSNSRTPAFAPHRMTRSNTLLRFGAPPPRSALKKVCPTIPFVQN